VGEISELVNTTRWSESVVTVLVCDESAVDRRRLVVALERSTGIEVVGEADDAEVVLAQVQEAVPDVVWLDVRLSGLGAVRLAAAIHQVVPAARVVLVAGHDDRDARRRAVRAGVVAVVEREHAHDRAAAVTARVAWGRTDLGPSDLQGVLDTFDGLGRRAGSLQQQVAPPELEERQRQAIEQLATGRPADEVATDLGVAAATVENLVTDAVAALHRHTRAEAVTYAVGAQLFDEA
jgi:DNA-binding NarL/FixJ family response regulator